MSAVRLGSISYSLLLRLGRDGANVVFSTNTGEYYVQTDSVIEPVRERSLDTLLRQRLVGLVSTRGSIPIYRITPKGRQYLRARAVN